MIKESYTCGGTEFVQIQKNQVASPKTQMIETDRRNATQLPERSMHLTNEMQRRQNQGIEEPMIVG